MLLIDLKMRIAEKFEVVDKGRADFFLGIEIDHDRKEKTISIHQQQYIKNLLSEYDMVEARKCSTVLDPGLILKKCKNNDCEKVNTKIFQSLIGSLLYLSISTRPDICHAVNKLSQFNTHPHSEHLAAAKHILRYLNTTINFKLVYKKIGKNLEGFADADWAGNVDDRKSYTGFTFKLANAAVVWESRKQPTVALSSTEAEYMSLSSASRDAIYLVNLLSEIGFPQIVKTPVTIHGDNLSAMNLVKNPVYHARSKHIDIKVHFIRELYQNQQIELKYVPSSELCADVLTKILNKQRHQELITKLGIVDN
jgi:hypothetical protein